jgi:hypothetical protein
MPKAASEKVRQASARVAAVMQAAERAGLLKNKSRRIAARVSPALVRQAKKHTGIDTDIELIAFALAIVALGDNFAATFEAARGKVDAALKPGF